MILLQILERLGEPHLNSFNHFLEDGMQTIIQSLDPYEFELINGERIKIHIESCKITPPTINTQIDVRERKVFPSEARQRSITYTGNCSMTLGWSKNDSARSGSVDFDLGPVPVMVRVSCFINLI